MKQNFIGTGIRVALASVLVVGVVAEGYALSTTTATLDLSATVVAACSVTVASPTLPNYVSGQAATIDAAATITPTCAVGTDPLYITLDLGKHSANYAPRIMQSGGNSLNYYLYTSTWADMVGDGATGGTVVLGTGGPAALATDTVALVSGTPVGINVRVAGGQTVPAGTYTDSVTATLYF